MTRAEIAEREARMLRKRQVTMVGLAIFLLITFISAIADLLPFKSLLLPISLLTIFVVHGRRQKVQEDVTKRRRIAASRGRGSTYNFSEITYRAPAGEASQWIPIDHSRTVTIIPNNSWQPSDMPLPTYVSAPKAPSRPVVNKEVPLFDQTAPEEVPQSQSAEVDEVFDQEQEPRASNG